LLRAPLFGAIVASKLQAANTCRPSPRQQPCLQNQEGRAMFEIIIPLVAAAALFLGLIKLTS